METPGEHYGSKSAAGPFGSQAEAIRYVHDDAKDTFMGMDGSLRDLALEDWGEAMSIVEERRRIKPTPHVTVKISMRRDSSANAEPIDRPS